MANGLRNITMSLDRIEELRPARPLAPANFIMVRATLKKLISEDKDQNGHEIRPKKTSNKSRNILECRDVLLRD